MKINVFRTQCKVGTRVCAHGDLMNKGTVKKISKEGTKALVQFDSGDLSWYDYYLIDII